MPCHNSRCVTCLTAQLSTLAPHALNFGLQPGHQLVLQADVNAVVSTEYVEHLRHADGLCVCRAIRPQRQQRSLTTMMKLEGT